MYKELRSNFLENGKSNQQRVDKALDIYSDIEFEIYKYLNDKSDLFIVAEKISKPRLSYPMIYLNYLLSLKRQLKSL
jgi:hypothetical protein